MLILFKRNGIFRQCFNYTVFYVTVMITAIIIHPYLLLHPKNVLNTLLFARIISPVNWIIGIRWQVRGEEHLKEDRACVIIANHQSSFDLLGMTHLWPLMNKCAGVAKKELLYIWPFGTGAWLCGTVFIDRSNSKKARATLERSLQRVKKEKIKLWMFPEGTRRKTGRIHEFKKGAFHLAVKNELPILPVVYSPYHYLSQSFDNSKQAQMIITALPAVSTKGLDAKDIPELVEKIRSEMSQVYQEMSKELQL